MEKTKSKVLNVVSKIALREAHKTADFCCIFFCYQPKLPDKVKKLRKF